MSEMIVVKDRFGNLLVKRGEQDVLIWYSYGRVYTVTNGEESCPTPADCCLVASAFIALATYFEKEATQ
jgi:hypothetical protein